MVAQQYAAARQLASAELALRTSKAAEARVALTEAGAAFFRAGDTDGVAYAVSRFVDAAITDGDPEAADLAVLNAIAVEKDLGLRLDGWRALASRARLHTALGDVDAASAAWAFAADQVDRLASLGELSATQGVPGPVQAVYAPWIELLLSDHSPAEAFAVAQRAASLTRGLVLDGRVPGSSAKSDLALLREEVGPLRDELASVSTRAGALEPAELRAPLLEQLQAIHLRWADTARARRSADLRAARRELVSGCTVAEVGERLGQGTVLYDEHRFDGRTVGFVVDAEGVTVLDPGDPPAHPGRKVLARAAHVVLVGSSEAPARLAATVPITRALLACDLLDVALPTGSMALVAPHPRPAVDDASAVSDAALTGSRAWPQAPVFAIAPHLDPGEPTRVVLDRLDQTAVIWVDPADALVFSEAWAASPTLDALRRKLRRAGARVSVWLSPPAP